MALEVRKATAGDLEPLWGLYAASCARQVPGDMGPDWHMGVYPARSDLEGRLAAGELYVGEQDGALVAGMVMTEGEDPIYAKVPWQVPAAPDEVAVLHLLVVDPAVRGRGVGSQMVTAAARVAAQAGKRVLHLDTLEQNTGAIAMYKRCGLSMACVMPVHYEDIGDASTVLFELVLDGVAAGGGDDATVEGDATAEGTAAAKSDAASRGGDGHGGESFSVEVITVSDRSFRGERPDASGPALVELVERLGYRVVATRLVPDEREQIEAELRDAAARGVALVLTTGGTGFSPRDVTPEATAAVCERMAPGIPEAMRAASLAITPKACLSREVAGIVGRTLVVNLPGSPKAAVENVSAVIGPIAHGLGILRGEALDG